ncbi:hypothetical protein LguiA_023198 [Lonicera macranthoides]
MDVMVFVERWKGLGTSGSMFEGFIYRISSSEMLSTRSIVRAEIPERQANYVSSGFDVRELFKNGKTCESQHSSNELDALDTFTQLLYSGPKWHLQHKLNHGVQRKITLAARNMKDCFESWK